VLANWARTSAALRCSGTKISGFLYTSSRTGCGHKNWRGYGLGALMELVAIRKGLRLFSFDRWYRPDRWAAPTLQIYI